MLKHRYAYGILIAVTGLAVAAMLFVDRIPQDSSYHLFADIRKIGGINNFWNVVSNLPFLFAGLFGLSRSRFLLEAKTRSAYLSICIGFLLVSIGSAYYHFAPSTQSLLWDRLPITIAFMSVFSILLDERVIPEAKLPTLYPLMAIGTSTAAYWYWTGSVGSGDLRPYVLVQFLPVVLIPLILMLFPGKYLNSRLLASALGLYVIAKLFEHFDRQVLNFIGVLSGHSIKHLLSGLAVVCIILSVPIKKEAH